MDIKEKQAVWLKEKPLFEAELIHSHLLPFFNFNENTGDYEIKVESIPNTDDEDRKAAYESLNTGWAMWLRAKRNTKAQAVPESLVVVFNEWFKKRHEKTGLYEEALCGKDDATYIKHEMRKAFQAGWKEKQAVPEGFNFGLAHDTKINDPKELLFRCLRNMKFEKGFRANQNWVHVKHMCCLGSTTATMLCRFFGVDPDGIKFEVIEAQEQSHE